MRLLWIEFRVASCTVGGSQAQLWCTVRGACCVGACVRPFRYRLCISFYLYLYFFFSGVGGFRPASWKRTRWKKCRSETYFPGLNLDFFFWFVVIIRPWHSRNHMLYAFCIFIIIVPAKSGCSGARQDLWCDREPPRVRREGKVLEVYCCLVFVSCCRRCHVLFVGRRELGRCSLFHITLPPPIKGAVYILISRLMYVNVLHAPAGFPSLSGVAPVRGVTIKREEEEQWRVTDFFNLKTWGVKPQCELVVHCKGLGLDWL